MSRIRDFMIVAVVTIFAIIMHYFGVVAFQPGSPLYEVAADATNLNGAERADLWFQIGTIWIPLIAIGGIWTWALVNEYRRQAVTQLRRPG